MATEWALRGKSSGTIYTEFCGYDRRDVEAFKQREKFPERYELVEREVGEWEVSKPDILHHYKRDGTLVLSFLNGPPVELAPDLVGHLREIL